MTDNSELEAAVINAIDDLGRHNNRENETNAFEAFTAYRERSHALEAENARLRVALLPFAASYAAYQHDHNNDPVANVLFGGEETRLNWFSIWMHHDGYKVAQEADYQQAAAMTADVEASSTSEGYK